MSSLSLALPAHFSVPAFLDFHGRDQHAISERVEGNVLHKAVIIDGRPCLLTLDFSQPGQVRTRANPLLRALLTRQTRAMLGLDQPVEAFEEAMAEPTALGHLVHKQRGLRVPESATPFEALSWAIIGQQISVSAATAIRRRFIQLAGQEVINGLHCYPDAVAVSQLDSNALRRVGFSASKAQTLLTVSQRCCDHSLLPDALHSNADAQRVEHALLGIRGLGPWSVNYTLLRGYGYLDGSLHGDVAVQKALQQLLAWNERPAAKATRDWLAEFTPWRALVAAHLWRSLQVQA
ncbi:base excision DNA repair protein [Alcanivorax sp.]|uniref:DNA-3-methyladenine glycosylase family protein n=1 Tax=Alcanivorax sp. TaxID=1872427 RepID=UPI002B26C91C|nr:base excision DNA repair protein [Alcanivorax sp.]